MLMNRLSSTSKVNNSRTSTYKVPETNIPIYRNSHDTVYKQKSSWAIMNGSCGGSPCYRNVSCALSLVQIHKYLAWNWKKKTIDTYYTNTTANWTVLLAGQDWNGCRSTIGISASCENKTLLRWSKWCHPLLPACCCPRCCRQRARKPSPTGENLRSM